MSWIDNFDKRQQQEIEFAKLYVDRFGHGTDGHNAKEIIAKMAKMLDGVESALNPVSASPYFARGGVGLRKTSPPRYIRWEVGGEPIDEDDDDTE